MPRFLEIAAVICLVTSAGASWSYIRVADRAPDVRADAPRDSAVVTWAGADQYKLMQALFWNRNATRVLVLGSGAAPDTYAFVSARLAAGPRVEAADGRGIPGPFVFTDDGLVIGGGKHVEHGPILTVSRAPLLVAFGWERLTGFVDPGASIMVAGESRPLRVALALRAVDGSPKTLGIRCDYGFDRVLRVGRRPARVKISVARERPQSCRIRLVAGGFRFVGGRSVSIQGTLAVRPG